jgi:hypothetical protein
MYEPETIKIEVDSKTARRLEIWYESVKDYMQFNNFGEFLLVSCRGFMKPYFKDIPLEKAQELNDLVQRARVSG